LILRGAKGSGRGQDSLDDVDVGEGSLLELKELGSLHQMLELENSFGHVVGLAPAFVKERGKRRDQRRARKEDASRKGRDEPFLESSDVVLDLHRW